MNTFKTFLLMFALTLLLIAVGGLIGGKGGMLIAFLIALAMNFGSYWFSDKVVLAMYHAKQLTREDLPELFQITEELTGRAGLPMPKLYLIENEQPNAFATGRDPQHAAVAVTSGIVRLLSRDELRGVISHELSHVKHRDILVSTLAATIAGAISFLATMAQWAFIFGGGRGSGDRDGGNPIGLLAMAIVAPIAALLIQLAISRSREYMADESGAKISGNPLSLASALKKLNARVEQVPMQAAPATAHLFIVNPLTSGIMSKLFSTHPPMEDRVARLEAMVYGKTPH